MLNLLGFAAIIAIRKLFNLCNKRILEKKLAIYFLMWKIYGHFFKNIFIYKYFKVTKFNLIEFTKSLIFG